MSSCKVPDILSHFYKICILSDFHEVLNNNCHGIPSSGSCADTCGHMDRHAKAIGASHDCECT